MDLADDATAPYVEQPLELIPFEAVLLAPRRVGDPASLRAFARPYRDVAARLAGWIDQGHAEVDTSPAIYVHEYTADGITIRGVVGCLDVKGSNGPRNAGRIWPHEAIHSEQAAELADRMAEMRLNPAPILLAHAGNGCFADWLRTATQKPAGWAFTDRAHQRHRIWPVRDTHAIADLNALLLDTDYLLADGHHRYAAYVELQRTFPGTEWDHGLVMLIDQEDTPLFLGAIHRILHGVSLPSLDDAVKHDGDVKRAPRAEALACLDSNTLLLTDGTSWRVVRPRTAHPAGVVGWLHDTLLTEVAPARSLSHHHDLESALSSASPDDTAVILPTNDFHHVLAAVQDGALLPEKATSFQPKPSLGVLMRRLHGASGDLH